MSLTIQEQIDKLRNNSAEYTIYISNVIAIVQELSTAIKENNLHALEKMMHPNYLPTLTSEKKIEIIFNDLHSNFSSNNTSESLMKSLIFDFQITERTTIISDDEEIPVDDRVKKMFQTRKLIENLNTELDSNGKQYKKYKL